METVTELKALVGKKRPRSDQEPRLYLAEHDDVLWATNSYWMVRAERVAPLLAHYNQPTNEPACYEVNGTVAAIKMDPPNVGQLIPAVGSSHEIHHRRENGDTGRHLFIRGNDVKVCPFLAVIDAGTDVVYVNDRFLSFVIGDVVEPVLRQQKPTGPIAVYDGKLFTDKNNGLLGLVMPVRCP